MSSQILLNFAVPFTEVIGTGQVDTTYLRKIAIVVKPKSGAAAESFNEVFDAAGLAAITDNKEALSLIEGGLNKFFVIATTSADLSGLGPLLIANENKFFTLHISNDFTDDAVLATKGFSFDGVISHSFATQANAKTFAAKHCAGVSTIAETKGHELCYALARLLSTLTFWGNQQYIDYTGSKSIETVSSLGLAGKYFDDRLTFWIFDDEEGTRLSGFFAGGEAITQKYISEELKLNLQSAAVGYVSLNQPMNVRDMRVALQNQLQSVVNGYEDDNYLDPDGLNQISVTDSNQEFWVNGALSVKYSKPIWRMAITATREK